MASIQVTESLLMDLGWEITAKNGRTVSVEPPQDNNPSLANFPKSFATVPQVVDYLQAEARYLDPGLADKIIKNAAGEAFNCFLRASGWETRPANRSQGPAMEVFPRRVAVFYIPPGSRFPNEGVEGQDYFSHRALFEALLETELGNWTLPGITREEAAEIVLESMFAEAWRCLEEAGDWKVDFTCGTDDRANIDYLPKGEPRLLTVFTSKRAFLRACHYTTWTRGMPPMPVAVLGAEDMGLDNVREVLWCKMVSPRYDYSWSYQIDGRPIFVPRELTADLGRVVMRQNAFESLKEFAMHMLDPSASSSGAQEGVPVAASRPRLPLQEQRRSSSNNAPVASSSSTPYTAAAKAPIRTNASTLGSTVKPATSAPSSSSRTTPVQRPSSSDSSNSAAAGQRTGTPAAGIIDISQGEHALSIDDDWPRFVKVLPKHGFGYSYRGLDSQNLNSCVLLIPALAGKNVDTTTMVEGQDFFKNKEQIIPYIQARYKTSHERTDLQSPRDFRVLMRKTSRGGGGGKVEKGGGVMPSGGGGGGGGGGGRGGGVVAAATAVRSSSSSVGASASTAATAATAAAARGGGRGGGSSSSAAASATTGSISGQSKTSRGVKTQAIKLEASAVAAAAAYEEEEQSPVELSPEARASLLAMVVPTAEDPDRYDDIRGDEDVGEIWAKMRRVHGWHHVSGNMFDSYFYCRTKRPKKGDLAEEGREWKHGIDYFHSEQEVYEYVMGRIRPRVEEEARLLAIAAASAPKHPPPPPPGGGKKRKIGGGGKEGKGKKSGGGGNVFMIEEEEEEEEITALRPVIKKEPKLTKKQKQEEEEDELEEQNTKSKRSKGEGKASAAAAAKKGGGRKSGGPPPLPVVVVPPAGGKKNVLKAVKKGGGKVKQEEEDVCGSPAASTDSTKTYWIDLQQNENWVYRYMQRWHGWKTKSGFRKKDGTENGYRYCSPTYGEAHQEEGKDWFRSLSDVKAFVAKHVEAGCLPFPSKLNVGVGKEGWMEGGREGGREEAVSPLTMGAAGSSKAGTAAAAVAAEEMEVEVEDGREGGMGMEEWETRVADSEVTGFESEEEMVRKLVMYHGFRKEGRKVIPPGGSARGQRGMDYLEGVEDLQGYVLEKLQGLPPTQAAPSLTSSSSSMSTAAMGGGGNEEYGAWRNSAREGGGKGKGKGKASGSSSGSHALQPTDLLDHGVLIKKLLSKRYQWKKEWPSAKNNMVQDYAYLPPGGNKAGRAGVDYAISFEDMRKMVVSRYFKGQEEYLLGEFSVPVVEIPDVSLTREMHFGLGGRGEEEEDEEEDEEEEDEEEEDEEEEERMDVDISYDDVENRLVEGGEEEEEEEGGREDGGKKMDVSDEDGTAANSSSRAGGAAATSEGHIGMTQRQTQVEEGEEKEEERREGLRELQLDSSTSAFTAHPSSSTKPRPPSRSSSRASNSNSSGSGSKDNNQLAPEAWFSRGHILASLRDASFFTAAVEILVKTHEWRVLPSQGKYLSATGKYYVTPGGRPPWEGGVHGVDYLLDHDELQNYIGQGFGLRSNQFAPIESVHKPGDGYTHVLSPLHDERCRSTRSGKAYTVSAGGRKGSMSGMRLDESPPALDLLADEEDDDEEEEDGRKEGEGDMSMDQFFHHAQGEEDEEEAEEEEEVRKGEGKGRARPLRSSKLPKRYASNIFSLPDVQDGGGEGGLFSSSSLLLMTGGGGDGDRNNTPLSSSSRRATGSVAARRSSASFVTPSLARASKKHKRTSKSEAGGGEGGGGGIAAATAAAALTPAEVDRYTYSVLKAKGWRLKVPSTSSSVPASSFSSSSMLASTQYELIPPTSKSDNKENENDEEEEEEEEEKEEEGARHFFPSEKDALAWARGKEGGKASVTVTWDELLLAASTCPYQPLINAMEKARSKLGQAGTADCYVSSVRGDEGRRLLEFYNKHLMHPEGAWIRVGGLPGTGKSLAVQHSEILLGQALEKRGVEARPTFVRVNCAGFTTPRSFLEALAGKLGLEGGGVGGGREGGRRSSVAGEGGGEGWEEELWTRLDERLRSKAGGRGGIRMTSDKGSSLGTITNTNTNTTSSSSSSSSSSSRRRMGRSFSNVLGSPIIKSVTSWFSGGGGKAAEEEEKEEEEGEDEGLKLPPEKVREQVGRVVVLVLDELDQFIATNKETSGCVARLIKRVVMDAGSRVLLVTVSNTIDDNTALGALWSKARAAAGKGRGRKGEGGEKKVGRRRRQPSWMEEGDEEQEGEEEEEEEDEEEGAQEPIIFRPFNEAELVMILKACVGETFQEPALAMIAKRVSSSRGDARVAVDTCRQVLEKHLRMLEEKARGWCPPLSPEEGGKEGGVVVVPTTGERQVTVPKAYVASREMDLDVVKDIGKLPLRARLLLLVLLHMTTAETHGQGGKEGGQVNQADLQNEYTHQAKAILGANQLGASSNFENDLEWIDENGLVERGRGGGRGGGKHTVSPKVDWATVLPKLTAQDKTLFKALLPT